jgi:hypothetical protein
VLIADRVHAVGVSEDTSGLRYFRPEAVKWLAEAAHKEQKSRNRR